MEEIKLRFVSTTKDATVTGTVEVNREDEVGGLLSRGGFLQIARDDKAAWVNLDNVFRVEKITSDGGATVYF